MLSYIEHNMILIHIYDANNHKISSVTMSLQQLIDIKDDTSKSIILPLDIDDINENYISSSYSTSS